MNKIVGNHDGKNGENETYSDRNRKNISRKDIIQEVKNGEHKGTHIVEINGKEYLKDSINRNRFKKK